MGRVLNYQFIWLKSAVLPLWSAAALRHSLRSKVQKFWFSRSHHCLVRILENHRLQKQTALTLTTDVLCNYNAAYVQSQVCCGTLFLAGINERIQQPL